MHSDGCYEVAVWFSTLPVAVQPPTTMPHRPRYPTPPSSHSTGERRHEGPSAHTGDSVQARRHEVRPGPLPETRTPPLLVSVASTSPSPEAFQFADVIAATPDSAAEDFIPPPATHDGMSSQFPDGGQVRIQGLQGLRSTELNGQVATFSRFIASTGRYAVRLSDGKFEVGSVSA